MRTSRASSLQLLNRWRHLGIRQVTAQAFTSARDAFPTEGSEHARRLSDEEGEVKPKLSEKKAIEAILRRSLLAEEASQALFEGMRRVKAVSAGLTGFGLKCNDPSIAAIADDEENRLRSVQRVASDNRIRPSVLSPAVKFAFGILGVGVACAPGLIGTKIVTSGLQEAIIESANGDLRRLLEMNIIDSVPEVRNELRMIRDGGRIFEGAPKVPDLISFLISDRRQLNGLSAPEALSMLVKFATESILHTSETL